MTNYLPGTHGKSVSRDRTEACNANASRKR